MQIVRSLAQNVLWMTQLLPPSFRSISVKLPHNILSSNHFCDVVSKYKINPEVVVCFAKLNLLICFLFIFLHRFKALWLISDVIVSFGLLHKLMIFDVFISDFSKSYVWSSLGVTALAFLTGALAFWLPTFLARAHVTQGLRPSCSKDTCDSTDRCSMTFDLLLFFTLCSLSEIRSYTLRCSTVMSLGPWRLWLAFWAELWAPPYPDTWWASFLMRTLSSVQRACWDQSPASS